MSTIKTIIIFLLTAFTAAGYAQSAAPKAHKTPVQNTHARHKLPKSLSVFERCIAYAYYGNNGATFFLDDSDIYTYSHGRNINNNAYFGGYATDSFFTYYQSSNTWDLTTSYYDSRNNDTLDLSFEKQGGPYDSVYANEYSYDGNNNLLSNLGQIWSGGIRINSTLENLTYNNDNQVLSDMALDWDGTGGVWVAYSNVLYTYTPGQETVIYQMWDQGTNYWDNISKLIYSYNAAGKDTQVTTQSWNGTAWVDSLNSIWEYSAAGTLLTEWDQVYISGQFETLYRVFHYQNADGFDTSVMTQSVNRLQIRDSLQTNNTYNSHNDCLSTVYQTFSASAGWVNTRMVNRTFDSYDNMTSGISLDWNAGGFWQPNSDNSEEFYYYELYNPPAAIDEVQAQKGSLNLSPVPANIMLNINLSWDAEQCATAAIYDASGKLCMQWGIPSGTSYTAHIPVISLAPGTYYLSVKGENGQLNKSFNVIR